MNLAIEEGYSSSLEGLEVDDDVLAALGVAGEPCCDLRNAGPRLPLELGELAGEVQPERLAQGSEDNVGFAVDLHGLSHFVLIGDDQGPGVPKRPRPTEFPKKSSC